MFGVTPALHFISVISFGQPGTLLALSDRIRYAIEAVSDFEMAVHELLGTTDCRMSEQRENHPTSTKGRSATLRGPKRILVSLPGEEKRFTS